MEAMKWRAVLVAAGLAAGSAWAETVRIEVPAGGERTAEPAPKPEASPTDGVVYRDGDRLRGQIIALDPAGGRMQWGHQPADARTSPVKPVEFSTAGARELWLAPRPAPGMREHSAWVTLTNGDLLAGEVVSLDKASLALDTWYAGRLLIRREMVAGVELSGGDAAKASVVYQGPGAAADWSNGGNDNGMGKFAVKDGALELWCELPRGMQVNGNFRQINGIMSTAGREIEEMPASARIEFEAEWPGAQPGFRVAFFSPKDRPRLFLVVGSEMALYSDFDDRADIRERSQGNWRRLLPGGRANRARFSILVDAAKRQCVILVNGRMAAKWEKIPEGMEKMGKSLIFSAQAGAKPTRFRNIRVSKWDGRLPLSGQDKPADAVAETDFVGFANGDGLSGEIQSITNGRMKLACAYGPMEIPLSRAAFIIPGVPGKKPQVARRETADMRLLLRDGWSHVTLKLERLADGRISGSSENFGAAALALGTLERIELNLYDEEAAPGGAAAVSGPASDEEGDSDEDADESGIDVEMI